MTTPKTGLRLGTTLYSLTTEFHSKAYSFESLIRRVAAEKLGPGLEVVGFQSIKGFPAITDRFAESFAALIDETALELSCLGINADAAIDRDRDLSEDEMVAYHEAQIQGAARMGFPVVRCQYSAGPNVLRRLVPLAEKLGIRMGLEIHAPHHPNHPVMLAYREMYEKVSSPFLGFVPDFGATAHAVPPSFLQRMRDIGVPEGLIELALEYWRGDSLVDGDGLNTMNAFHDAALAAGANERFVVELFPIFGLFSRHRPEDWAEVMHQVVHIHGKFFDFDENGTEVSVDYARILPVFVKGGYNGFMSSEYEGHHWGQEDGFDKIRRHHALVRGILAPLQQEARI